MLGLMYKLVATFFLLIVLQYAEAQKKPIPAPPGTNPRGQPGPDKGNKDSLGLGFERRDDAKDSITSLLLRRKGTLERYFD